MNIQLSADQSRVVAIAIACLMLVMIFLLLIYPVVKKYNSYSEEIVRLNKELIQYKAQAGKLDDSQRRLKQVKQRDLSSQDYLKKHSPTMASAELQAAIKRVIKRDGAELISTQVVNAQGGETTDAVTVKIRLKCSISALQKILYSLEMSRPILFLDNAVVQVLKARRKTASGVDSVVRLLTVSFDVSGYRRRQEG